MIQELAFQTPALVYDQSRILKLARLLEGVRSASDCKILYSIKAFPFEPVLRLLEPWVDGFSVSSLYEAKLAAMVGNGSLHITTPGLRADEMSEIGGLCGFIGFNSLEQFRRLQPLLAENASAGIRVNPKRSFLKDCRYDPCGEFSKLGVPLERLATRFAEDHWLQERIRGLHFHTVFASTSFDPLRETVALIEKDLAQVLSNMEWLNLGGGYLFETESDFAGLIEIARGLRRRWGVDVYFEPGKALVGDSGYLVASVIDLFESDGKQVAILDTSVNHHPEVFEYQIRPEPAWLEPQRGHVAILAGCTCLAGDVFGQYRFEKQLSLGDRLAFRNVGAYSLIKANRFNGYNLPTIYAWDGHQEYRLMKSYGYADYLGQWQAEGAKLLD